MRPAWVPSRPEMCASRFRTGEDAMTKKPSVIIATILLLIFGAAARGAAADIFVTTYTQKIGTSGGCSLQEAIYSANFDNNIAIDYINADGSGHFLTDLSGQLAHTECVPGSGADRIVLARSRRDARGGARRPAQSRAGAR